MTSRRNQLVCILVLPLVCAVLVSIKLETIQAAPLTNANSAVLTDQDDPPQPGARPAVVDENTATIAINDENGVCFAQPSWIYRTLRAGDSVTWNSVKGQPYTVTFTGNSPFASKTVNVTSSAPGTGTVTQAAMNACTSTAAGNCYFPYTIKVTGSAVNHCTSNNSKHRYAPGLHIKP
jgi:hypothetical protein